LRDDLKRFVFLLGGSDGGQLFGPGDRDLAAAEATTDGAGSLPAHSASSRCGVVAVLLAA
jgi:hypothetical protein